MPDDGSEWTYISLCTRTPSHVNGKHTHAGACLERYGPHDLECCFTVYSFRIPAQYVPEIIARAELGGGQPAIIYLIGNVPHA